MLKIFRRLVAHSGETAGPLNIIRHLEKMDFTDWLEKNQTYKCFGERERGNGRGGEERRGEERTEERRGEGGKGRNQSKIRSDLSD